MKTYFSYPKLRELAFVLPPLIQFRMQIWVAVRLALGHLPAPPDRVLEIGAATGWLSRRLARALPRSRVEALDLSAAMIRAAQQTPHPPNLFFRVGDMFALPEDPVYDLVVSAHTWMLLPPEQAFPHLHAMLHPEGVALLTLTFPGLFTRMHRAFFERVSGGRLRLHPPDWWCAQAEPWFETRLFPVHEGEPSGLLWLKKRA
ncbi:MAG: class I SAM-dependent methyltransferase [Candidatus Hydrothermae bacterium]|nr:class I SAM-dependent methyltransferase [Candidatus Hydrothermae bacterium]